MFKFLILLVSILLFACAKGGPGEKKTNRPQVEDSAPNCDNSFTKEKIDQFNLIQNKFQIQPGGQSFSCHNELNVNGKVQLTRGLGFTDIYVLPNYKFVSLSSIQNRKATLKLSWRDLVWAEKLEIIQALGVNYEDGLIPPIQMLSKSPGYLRLGKGNLYPTSLTHSESYGYDEHISYFEIRSGEVDLSVLEKQIQEGAQGKGKIELFWPARKGQLPVRVVSFNPTSESWEQLPGLSVLDSYIKLSEGLESEALLDRATSKAIEWEVSLIQFAAESPQVLDRAKGLWGQPNFNLINQKIFLKEHLFLLNAVDPGFASASEVLKAFEEIGDTADSELEALSIAYDYAHLKKWTKSDFTKILFMAKTLKNTSYDKCFNKVFDSLSNLNGNMEVALDLINTVVNLKTRGASNCSDYVKCIDLANERLSRGLDSRNSVSYWGTVDRVISQLRVDIGNALPIVDDMVLRGLVPSKHLDRFLLELKHFQTEFKLGLKIIYDELQPVLEKKGPEMKFFRMISDVGAWMKNEVELPAPLALVRAKEMVFDQGMTAVVFAKIQSFYGWVQSGAKIKKQDSLNEAIDVIHIRQFSANDIGLLKEYTEWRISEDSTTDVVSIYQFVKSLFINGKKISRPEFLLIKDLTMWNYAEGNYSSSEAHNLSLGLVLYFKFDQGKASLYKNSASWLIKQVGIFNRKESTERAVQYIEKGSLTVSKLNQLKSSYLKNISLNTRKEALQIAECEVLKLGCQGE